MAIQPISKFRTHEGRPESAAEYRARRRGERKSHETREKAEVRARDGRGCRWPGCTFDKKFRVECAHLVDKGMGGDPMGVRTKRALMIRLCHVHHQGGTSIHSGDLDIVFLTSKGTDGPVQFLRKNPKAKNGWEIEGVENDFDVSQRAKRARDEFAEDEGAEDCA